jgi:hypothetical protein
MALPRASHRGKHCQLSWGLGPYRGPGSWVNAISKKVGHLGGLKKEEKERERERVIFP